MAPADPGAAGRPPHPPRRRHRAAPRRTRRADQRRRAHRQRQRTGPGRSVFTADTAHGFEAARRVRTSTFSVNTFAADLGWPFGGFKKSGLGREHDPGAVEEFLLTKTVSTDPGAGLTAEVTQGVPLGTGPGTHGPVK
ncbi:aldehyde dehydrogenase family protein [Streptomyces sp. NPDC057717]|uniref:aldehyde dehydrogenase family protein n=1 Tax=unclassified Streptomyces TaxID=2593676 RepID=UPI003630BC87